MSTRVLILLLSAVVVSMACPSARADGHFLPVHLSLGWNLFGYSHPVPQLWSDFMVTDGVLTYDVMHAELHGWIQAYIYGYSPSGGYEAVLPTPGSYVTPGSGYWLLVFYPGLQLLIPEPTYDVADFWPLAVGNLWVADEGGGQYSTHEITGTATVGGHTAYVLRNDDPDGVSYDYIALTADGVVSYRWENDDGTEYDEYTPSQWWIPFRTCQVGDVAERVWTETGYEGGSPAWTSQSRLSGVVASARAEPDSPLGSLSVVLQFQNAVHIEADGGISAAEVETWYVAKGIGPVFVEGKEWEEDDGSVSEEHWSTPIVYAVVDGVAYGTDPR